MDLVSEIADAGRRMLNPFGGFNPFGPDMLAVGDLGMDDESLKTVTDFERRTRKYPKDSQWPFFGGGRSAAMPVCGLPAGPRRDSRAQTAPPVPTQSEGTISFR